MQPRTWWAQATRTRVRVIALCCVVALLLAAGVWWALGSRTRTITAYFSTATAIFEGNEVKVLGVPIGRIASVTPQGTVAKVEMEIDRDLKLPADVRAAAVSPSLVTGRFVQLSPPYRGGPELPAGAVLDKERTAAPLGVDDLLRTVDEVARTLGPDGVNSKGALSDALDVGAQNLDGNGKPLNDALRNLGGFAGTLADSRKDLFATITQLQTFVSTLASKDGEVRQFNVRLADVTKVLADERADLGGALQELSLAMGQVSSFVADNRAALKSNVDKLTQVTRVLVNQRAALVQILDTAPLALNNLDNAYNGSSGTLDTRANLNELAMPPAVLLCELLRRGGAGVPPALVTLCESLRPLGTTIPLPTPAELISALQSGKLPQVPGLAGAKPKAGGR